MTARIFAYVAQKGGVVDDSAAELAAAARKIDAKASVTAIVTGSVAEVGPAAEALTSFFSEVWKIGSDALAYPNGEVVRKALVKVVPRSSLVLTFHNHFGMDLVPGLSIQLGSACVSDIVDVEGMDGTFLKAVRQEYGGQVSTHVRCDLSSGAVLSVRPGAFQWVEGAAVRGAVVDRSSGVGDLTARRRYVETLVAETGGVDIAKEEVLVSVGRGIQERDNIAIAQDLADALGAALCCSRPVVDAKWMEKSRQVGTSGKTVKPRIYLACGIRGAFQHLGGLKGKPFIVAINKDAKAPIFRVADVGVVADILEFLPILTSKIREL